MTAPTLHLLKHYLKLEYKSKATISGLIIYAAASVFICNLVFNQSINSATWNALLWIILLFICMNASVKSFNHENSYRFLLYYQLVAPNTIIKAKIVHSTAIMVLLALVTLGCYSFMLGNPVNNNVLYITTLVLGCFGLATTLTLIAALSSKAGIGPGMMAVLGFPVIIPQLMASIKLSKMAMDGLDWSVSYRYLIILIALNIISVSLSLILFPFIWKD
ncbi:MAG: hypothetical protein RIQ89_2226 [Bacteroidota bacterium]|jgi:heme exporter protein B